MITLKKTGTGFEYLEIQNKSAEAKIALQGGHIFHYQQRGHNKLLWLSNKSLFKESHAIRGGIPLCWPWFGKHPSDPELPQHGFARTSPFELLDANESDAHSTELILHLQDSSKTLALWPYHFHLQLRIIIGPTLTLALSTRNDDARSFTISSALHSYFSVSDIAAISVSGLDKLPYWDALDEHGPNKVQRGDLRIRTEVDRVYQQLTSPLLLHDVTREIHIRAQGSSTAVVWNPWKEKSRRMKDMENDSYKDMLCLETANALDDARVLKPGEKHTLQVDIS